MNNFKLIVLATLTLFMGMLVFVTMTAFSRKSGNTGLDMAKIHLMRLPAKVHVKDNWREEIIHESLDAKLKASPSIDKL